MCRNCYPATRTISAITYAVPVDIVSLGASLAALKAFQPTIQQLQLCHRFGQGGNVHLTKLPQELLDLVVAALFTTERSEHYDEWSSMKVCYDAECSPIDHYNQDQLDAIKDDLLQEIMSGCDDDEDVEHTVNELLPETLSNMDWYDVCTERVERWVQLTTMDNPESPCPRPETYSIANNSKILRRRFGLETITMKQTIPSAVYDLLSLSPWRDHPQQESLAYLALPCKRHNHNISDQDSEYNDYNFEIDSSAGMAIELDPNSFMINEERKQRFCKAMKFLQLKPKMCKLQVLGDSDKDGPIIPQSKAARDAMVLVTARKRIDAKVKEIEESEWPKLINFTSVSVNFGPY